MFEFLENSNVKKGIFFAGGVLFGTAGIKILASKDAKKVYVNSLAAALRMKEGVMKTAVTVQENAEDILAEANQINEGRMEEACALEEDSDEKNEL